MKIITITLELKIGEGFTEKDFENLSEHDVDDFAASICEKYDLDLESDYVSLDDK